METRSTPRGLLRIDAATPVVLHFLMPLIKPFRERYPEMTLLWSRQRRLLTSSSESRCGDPGGNTDRFQPARPPAVCQLP
jgi:DNA-binding transcriptional LysR family regulator